MVTGLSNNELGADEERSLTEKSEQFIIIHLSPRFQCLIISMPDVSNKENRSYIDFAFNWFEIDKLNLNLNICNFWFELNPQKITNEVEEYLRI